MKKIIIKTEILGRDVVITFLDPNLFTKRVIEDGNTAAYADTLNGYCTPDNKIVIKIQNGFKSWRTEKTPENTFYMFEQMEQTLWHEVGHIISRTIPASIVDDEWTPTIGEHYFILQRTLKNIIKTLKARLK